MDSENSFRMRPPGNQESERPNVSESQFDDYNDEQDSVNEDEDRIRKDLKYVFGLVIKYIP
jgi:hypothetical protein